MLAKDYFICGGCSVLLPVSIKAAECPPGIILKKFGEEDYVNQIVVMR